MKLETRSPEKLSGWQLVFLQSKVNGAAYFGERLAPRSWNWPKDTYLQRRLQDLRGYRPFELVDSDPSAQTFTN